MGSVIHCLSRLMQILQNPCQFLRERVTLESMTMDDEDEDALWKAFTKDMDVLPRPPALPEQEKKKSVPQRQEKQSRVADVSYTVPPASSSVASGTDLDRRTEEKLLSGRMPIEGRLDLHGMTQAQAQRALSFFIEESLARERRTLLVITGKGRGGALASETAPEDWISPSPGVLRQNMPRWLDAPTIRPHILKIVPAQPKHGGSGAFYIYLRRARPAG